MLQHVCYEQIKYFLYSISKYISASNIIRIQFTPYSIYLFVFVPKAIRIRICIWGYPCSNPNLIENVKTNTISGISIRIRSIHIHCPRSRWPQLFFKCSGKKIRISKSNNTSLPLRHMSWAASGRPMPRPLPTCLFGASFFIYYEVSALSSLFIF